MSDRGLMVAWVGCAWMCVDSARGRSSVTRGKIGLCSGNQAGRQAMACRDRQIGQAVNNGRWRCAQYIAVVWTQHGECAVSEQEKQQAATRNERGASMSSYITVLTGDE